MPAAPCFYLFGIIIRFRSNSLFRPYFSPYKHRPAEPTQNAHGSKYLFDDVKAHLVLASRGNREQVRWNIDTERDELLVEA